MLLNKQIALVTGGLQGIGAAIVDIFRQEGAIVLISDIRPGADYQADAANFHRAHEIVDDIVRQYGRLDIMVNNAGVTSDGLLLRMTEQQWDQVIDIDLKSAFNYLHAVAPVMIRQRSGTIISMSSVVGVHGNAGQANYAASKAGIIALTQSAAQELGGRGIRVNAIAPGFVDTDMTRQLPEQIRADFLKRIPLRRPATANEIAKVALFLASDMSSYVSGQVIEVTGAMH